MNRKTTLGVMLALVATAPAVVVPKLVPSALAQGGTLATPGAPAAGADRAEYPDVPRNHWAYQAIDRLSRAGIIEGYPNGTFIGNKPMTRYEFAVAIARILDRMGGPGREGPPGPQGQQGPAGAQGIQGPPGPGTNIDTSQFVTRAQLNDLIAALRREFADELARLGSRVEQLETRTANLENRVTTPPRTTITPSFLHRGGLASYVTNTTTPASGNFSANTFQGRNIFNGVQQVSSPTGTLTPGAPGTAPTGALPVPAQRFFNNRETAYMNQKFSYTDFELRLTDRVTDRLSANAALRSIGGTQEDPWGPATSGLWAREAFVRADLSDHSWLGLRGLSATLGRQKSKIGQGLLYDNSLSPTDQANVSFNLGPFAISGFVGTTNNENFASGSGLSNPYLTTGALAYVGTNGVAGGLNTGLFFPNNPGGNAARSGAIVGFPGQTNPGTAYIDDNESLARASFNLFKISGQPVSIGISRQFDGVQNQQGDSVDLSLPLFNRTIGVEYVRQRRYFSAGRTQGNPKAYNITLPLFRSNFLDVNAAYGRADNDFEYFASSSANPFARTYAEALFDRPLALGAPMINGRFFSRNASPTGLAGLPAYVAAKEAIDFNGTVRLPIAFLRRIPLDFRYYRAFGSTLAGPGGRQKNRLDLGDVYTVGSTFNVTPGLDLELKYGHYRVPGPYPSIYYFRVGANVGF